MRNSVIYHIMLLVVSLGCVALFVGCRDNSSPLSEKKPQKTLKLSVVKQLPLKHDAALPIAVVGGFIIADAGGNVRYFNHSYQPLWNVTHKGMDFTGGATVENGRLFLGSGDGSVLCMDIDDGSTIWTNAMDAAFSYPPLYGSIKDKSALWLLSSDDGIVYCLNAENGDLLWKSKETNRSDGGMVFWHKRLVYGNCDGAAHIFDAVNGSMIASVPVGESDQMAGSPIVNDDGMLFIGTRQGNLAVVDINRAELRATLKISEQEAFAVPALCGENAVAFGVQEGDILLIGMKDRYPFIKSKYTVKFAVEFLLHDNEILYALSNGNLMAFDNDLKLNFSLNVGDSLDGLTMVGSDLVAVKADNSLLFVKGEWK